MERLKSNFLNMALVLTIISLVAAGALAAVYSLTVDPIAQAKAQKEEQAVRDVLPDYTRLEADSVDGLAITRAYNGDVLVGSAVKTEDTGFGGTIKLMVGFDAEGKIVNYSVLEQTETPGLGTKMVDWFKTDKNRQNVCGLNPSQVNFKVSKDGGDIDAITAATISSRAFLRAVQKAYNAAVSAPQTDGASSASAQIANDSVDAETSATGLVQEAEPQAVTGASQCVDSAASVASDTIDTVIVKSENNDTL